MHAASQTTGAPPPPPRAWARILLLPALLLLLSLILLAACGAPKLYEDTPVGQVPETSDSLRQDLQSAAEDDARPDDDDRDSAPDSDLADAPDPDRDRDDSTSPSDSLSDARADRDRSTPGVDSTTDDPPPPTRAATTPPGSTSPASPAASPTAGIPAPTETGASAEDMLGRTIQGGSLGSIYRLTDLRSGRHEGFTRFVWELSSEAGSGPYFEAVEERTDSGDLRIRLRVSDLYAYDYTGAMSLELPPDATATSLRPLTTADDAIMAFAVDLERPARYAITTLQDPLRIVLDVYDD